MSNKSTDTAVAKKKNKTKKAAVSLLIKVGVIAAAIWVVFTFIIAARIQHDNTMFPTIRDGELALFKRFGDYTKDDIILYKTNGNEMLGRVIAIGGDIVRIDEGGVMVNGSYRMDSNPYPTPFDNTEEVRLEEDEVYVLADYREEMNDSRLLGPIEKESIIGELFFTMRYRGF